MAKKLFVVFVMCLIVLAAVNVATAQDDQGDYQNCYKDCGKQCEYEGNGYTFCEMKCDANCAQLELKAKMSRMMQH
ncbi:hypothetical protein LguiB_030615 [Lonicera macranthoides]